MDRQLAERMVGAACLLAVLVLVVPAILDGNPESDATITHPSIVPSAATSSAPLGSQTADGAAGESVNLRTHTIRLDGPGREPPVPTPRQVNLPLAASPAPEPEPVTTPSDLREPATIKAATPAPDALAADPRTPVVATGSGSGNWIVQLGSFSQRGNADRLASDVQNSGFSASVRGGGGASGNLFRVRAGPAADRVGAEELAARLAAAGFKGGRVGRE
jgi:DedD protein